MSRCVPPAPHGSVRDVSSNTHSSTRKHEHNQKLASSWLCGGLKVRGDERTRCGGNDKQQNWCRDLDTVSSNGHDADHRQGFCP